MADLSMDSDNPHTENRPYCRVNYWRDSAACGRNDGWTHARVEAFGQFPFLRFGREAEDAMQTTLRLMDSAYEAGRRAKAREVLGVLGVNRG